ncbi:kinesin-like protein, partial [Euroglyphus maynei]
MAYTFNETSMMDDDSKNIDGFSSTNLSLQNLTFDKCDQSNMSDVNMNEQKIKTFLRIRSDVEMDSRYKINGNNLLIEKNSKKTDEYCFDKILDKESNQFDTFKNCTLPLLKDFIVGKNSLVFTFGVTSSGKTFTMKGNLRQPGIIPYSFVILFQTVINAMTIKLPTYKPINFSDRKRLSDNDQQYEDEIRRYMINDSMNKIEDSKNFETTENMIIENHSDLIGQLQTMFDSMSKNRQEVSIWISYFEIYNDTIIDLLNVRYKDEPEPKVMLVKDDRCQYYVHGIRHVFVKSAYDAYLVYLFGQNNLKKHIAQTILNLNSSRSHSIFKLTLIRVDHSNGQSFTSSINFCDLAGAERIGKTGNVGQRAKETNKINQSLSLLNQCISALTTKKDQHLISFRSSKLTHVLQPYLFSNGGSFSTIINLNPSTKLFDESIYSLNFCDNIKSVPPLIMTSYKRRLTVFQIPHLDDVDENFDDEEQDETEENNKNQGKNIGGKHCHCDKLMKEKEFLEEELQDCRQQYEEIIADLEDDKKIQKEFHENELKRNDQLWLMRIDCINDKYQSELETKNDKIEKLESQLFDVQTELVELNESKQNREELQQKLQQKNQEFEKLEQQFITLMAEKESLRKNVVCYEKEISRAIGNFVDQFDHKMMDMRNFAEKLKQYEEIITLQSKRLNDYSKLEKELVETYRMNNQQLEKQREDLENQRKDLDNQREELEKQRKELENKQMEIVKQQHEKSIKIDSKCENNNSDEIIDTNHHNESTIMNIFSTKKKKRAATMKPMSSCKKIKMVNDQSPSTLISPDTMVM